MSTNAIRGVPCGVGGTPLGETLATNLLQMGVDDLTIQAIMRHSNVSVTQKYCIKTAGGETRAATQKMEEVLTDT